MEVVLEADVLVGELLAVDGLAAGAGPLGEVAALQHELRDHTVEDGSLVVEGLAAAAACLLAGAEGAEILGGPRGDVGEELHDDAAGGLVGDGDVEEDL